MNVYLARYYDSRTGTFCSADPLAGDPSDPQSWNRYAYGRNNPVMITDPSRQNWLFSLMEVVGFGLAPFTGGATLSMAEAGATMNGFDNLMNGRPPWGLGFEDFGGGMALGSSWNGAPIMQYPGLTAGIQGALGLPTMADAVNPAMDATALNGKTYNFSSCMANGANDVSLAALLPKGTPQVVKNLAGNDFSSLQQGFTGPDRLRAWASVGEGKGTNAVAQGIGKIPVGTTKYLLGMNGAGTYYVRDTITPRIAKSALGKVVGTLSSVKVAYDLGSYLGGLVTCPIWGK